MDVGTIDIIITRVAQLVKRAHTARANRTAFDEVRVELESLPFVLRNVRKLFSTHHSVMHPAALSNFMTIIRRVSSQVDSMHSLLESLTKLFDPNEEPSFSRRLRHKGRRFTAADAIDTQIAELRSTAREVHASLLQLTGFLNVLEPSQSVIPATRYKVWNNVSALDRHVVVSFNPSSGSFEAKLKHDLLSLGPHTAQRMAVAVGVAGMGGIGKTTALTALGWDMDVRERFCHGVFFLAFGRDAEHGHVLRQLSKIVRKTGAEDSVVDAVARADDVREACERTAEWFHGRKVLFLCDDLWSSPQRPLGYLPELRELLGGQEESCMVITTRDNAIANEAGICVQFSARNPHGELSRRILLNNAHVQGVPEMLDNEAGDELETVLAGCAGHPLTLAVAGRAIAGLRKNSDSWTKALTSCIDLTTRNRRRLLRRQLPSYMNNFESAVLTSLQIADEWLPTILQSTPPSSISCSTLLIRLCVLKRQMRVNVVVLQKLWFELDEFDVPDVRDKLVDLNLLLRGGANVSNSVIGLHDNVLELCEYMARDRKLFGEIHRSFLSAYLRPPCTGGPHHDTDENLASSFRMMILNTPSSSSAEDALTANKADLDLVNEAVVQQLTRPWWTLSDAADDGFISANVCRLLLRGGLLVELVGLLSHAAWIKKRMELGDVTTLLFEFDEVIDVLYNAGLDKNCSPLLRALRQLRDASSDMWLYVKDDSEEIASQVHARLLDIQDPSGLLHRCMKSSADCLTGRRWLRPTRRQWPIPLGSGLVEIMVGEPVNHISMDWKKNIAYAATKTAVLEIDLRARKVISSMLFPVQNCRWVVMSKCEQLLAIVLKSGDLTVWDYVSNSFLWKQSITDEIFAAEWSTDGALLAVGVQSGTVSSLKGRTGQTVFSVHAHHHAVFAVALSRHGRILMSVDAENEVAIWNTEHGICIARLNGFQRPSYDLSPITVSGDGCVGMMRGNKPILYIGSDSISAKGHMGLKLEDYTISSLDERGERALVRMDRGLQWNSLATEIELSFLPLPSEDSETIALDLDAERVAVAGETGVLRLWDLSLDAGLFAPSITSSTYGSIRAIVLSSNRQKLLAIGKGGHGRWEVATGTLLLDESSWLHKDAMSLRNYSVLFAASTEVVVTMTTTSICCISRDSGAVVYRNPRPAGFVHVLATNHDGSLLLFVEDDGVARWRLANGTLCHEIVLSDMRGVPAKNNWSFSSFLSAMSEHGDRAAMTHFKSMWLCDTSIAAVVECGDETTALTMSRKGDVVVWGSARGGVHVGRWESDGSWRTVWERNAAHAGEVTCLWVSSKGRWMASGGEDRRVVVWKNGGDLAGPSAIGRQSEWVEVAGVSLRDVPSAVTGVESGSDDGEELGWLGIGDFANEVWTFEMC